MTRMKKPLSGTPLLPQPLTLRKFLEKKLSTFQVDFQSKNDTLFLNLSNTETKKFSSRTLNPLAMALLLLSAIILFIILIVGLSNTAYSQRIGPIGSDNQSRAYIPISLLLTQLKDKWLKH